MNSDPNRFDGRVAVVTGAARGIGARIAATLAQRGATVAQADLLDDWAGRAVRRRAHPAPGGRPVGRAPAARWWPRS